MNDMIPSLVTAKYIVQTYCCSRDTNRIVPNMYVGYLNDMIPSLVTAKYIVQNYCCSRDTNRIVPNMYVGYLRMYKPLRGTSMTDNVQNALKCLTFAYDKTSNIFSASNRQSLRRNGQNFGIRQLQKSLIVCYLSRQNNILICGAIYQSLFEGFLVATQFAFERLKIIYHIHSTDVLCIIQTFKLHSYNFAQRVVQSRHT